MEEMRSFGYICPACGKAVLHSRSVFALNAAAARMECECGKEALTAETDGLRFRLHRRGAPGAKGHGGSGPARGQGKSVPR